MSVFVRSLALTAALAAAAQASTLPRVARFAALHGAATHEIAQTLLRGMTLEGVEMSLRDGMLTLTVARAVMEGQTTATNISATAALVMDDQFFQAPVTGVVRAFQKSSDIMIDRLDMSWSGPTEGVEESMAVKNVHVATRNGAFSLSARSIVGIKAQGQLHWHASAKKLDMEVQSVKAGGFPVGLDLAFGLMSKFMNFEFVELANPHVFVDVGALLR